MQIVVNGESRTLEAPATVASLLASLELDPRTVVVELNQHIVRRGDIGEAVLSEGDRVELVHFVGGG